MFIRYNYNQTAMSNTRIMLVAGFLGASLATLAQEVTSTDTLGRSLMGELPHRSIVLNGDRSYVHTQVLEALLDTRDLSFHDPGVPRYLIIDKEGTSLFGIGGYIEGVAMADFRGAIDNSGFVTYDIPIPGSPSTRSRLGADVSHSTIFMKLVKHTRLGALTAYIQSNFTGDNGGYGFKLKQAYVTLGNVTMGLANSTFSNPASELPTIDYQGPSGQVGCKNVLLRYRVDLNKHWSMALSAELPTLKETPLNQQEEALSQSLPDIPLYLQYCWGTGNSHVRIAGIIRSMSYRNLVENSNKRQAGYGIQLRGIIDLNLMFEIYYIAAWGRGIAHYINDLDGNGYDLVGSSKHPGEMIAPRTVSFVGGLRYNINKEWFMMAGYSMNQLYDQKQLGADSYRRGNYMVVNAFYSPMSDLMIGAEYLHGTRRDVSGVGNSANRIDVMVKYSF